MGEHGKWGKRKRRGRGFDSMPYPQRRRTETIEFRERKQQGRVCFVRFLFCSRQHLGDRGRGKDGAQGKAGRSGDGDPGFLGARQGGLGGGSRRERKGALGDGGAQGWRRRADGCARDGHGQGEVQGPCRNQGRQGDWRGAGGKGVGFRRLEEKNGRESG
jgi:hypothetical protein